MNAIYLIRNKINSKCYVGKTADLLRRKTDHFTNTHNKHLKRSINLYGKENFSFELVEENIKNCDIDLKERYYIQKFDAFNNGYNQTLGGEGGNTLLNDEVAKAHSIATSESKVGKKRKPFAEEHKAKLRKVLLDNPGYKIRSKPCMVEGKIYESQHAASRATGILQATINYRLKTNKPGYEYI